MSALPVAIVDHISALVRSDPGNEALKTALNALSQAWGVSDGQCQQYRQSNLSLIEIFQQAVPLGAQPDAMHVDGTPTPTAGAAAAPAVSSSGAPAELEVERKFADYVALLKSRGYFGSAVEGSPEYESRLQRARQKLLAKFAEATGAGGASPSPPLPTTTPTTTPTTSSSTTTSSPTLSDNSSSAAAATTSSADDALKRAEAFKNEGNAHVSAKRFSEAILAYTRAIELQPGNAVYYCNRAAAHSQLGNYHDAIADAKKATALEPSYSKAHARLGFAYFNLEQYEQSVASYRKAVELDPTNANVAEALTKASQKLHSPPAAASPAAPASAGFPGMPQMPAGFDPMAMMNDPGFASMASSLLQNPQFASLAQQMMSDPEALRGLQEQLGGMFGRRT